ncbi:MAG: hypothetical protein ACOCRX_09300 [Candidatus Woesearchaeota archaeon]
MSIETVTVKEQEFYVTIQEIDKPGVAYHWIAETNVNGKRITDKTSNRGDGTKEEVIERIKKSIAHELYRQEEGTSTI